MKRKPVLDSFIEATYLITDNSEDYQPLTSIREYYEAYCVAKTITPMPNTIFQHVLMNRYPQLGLTTMVISGIDTVIITRIKFQ